MKIEVESVCDGVFAVYQEDEGKVDCVILSKANIATLFRRAFPEQIERYREGLDSSGEQERRMRTSEGPLLRLVEKEAPQDAAMGA